MIHIDGVLRLSCEGEDVTVTANDSTIVVESDHWKPIVKAATTRVFGPQMLRVFASKLVEAGLTLQFKFKKRYVASVGYGVEADFAAKMLGIPSARIGDVHQLFKENA